MNVLEAFRPSFFRNASSPAIQSVSISETASDLPQPEQDSAQLQLYCALPGDDYIHKLAAEAAIMRGSCEEAEQHLEELENLSLERLNTDYKTRLRFIQQWQDRADMRLEVESKKSANNAASTLNQPGPPRTEIFPNGLGVQGINSTPPAPSARERGLEKELAEAVEVRRACADRFAELETAGLSPTRSAGMRLFGGVSLVASAVILAILFDPFTREFAVLQDLIDGIRTTFLPSSIRSQQGVIVGFGEMLLFFLLPLAIAFGAFRMSRPSESTKPASPMISAWGICAIAIYVMAVIATFAQGEIASRLLIDSAFAIGVTAVSAGLVFFLVSRSNSTHGGVDKRSPASWEKLPTTAVLLLPVTLLAFALAVNLAPWLKLIPVALLGCLLMTGAVSLAKGVLFRDLAAEMRQREAKIEGLKAEIEKERQSSLNRADSASAMVEAADAAANLLPHVVNTISGQASEQTAVIKDALKSVIEIASPIKARECAERSLRSYESAVTHLEDRYSGLLTQHKVAWKRARIDLHTAYALCRMSARRQPAPPPVDKGIYLGQIVA
jgi:hypothetical protein